jgi:hypothetical protein
MLKQLILPLLLVGALSGAPSMDTPVDFQKDVRPILSDQCFACHGPDENARKADLRLDTRDGAFANRGGSSVIIAGNAADSRLYQRISHAQEVARMPPPTADRHPSPEQIETIRRWIDQGAQWQTHWAYEPISPVSADSIDDFVQARLGEEGLSPAREADRRTLLRRVSFDLTGLPPSPSDLEAFLKDRSPKAFENQVDRLLGSEHYGERLALEWLDLARYADTHGYHIDSKREMWQWRDWVIRSFNENKPFDEFTVEQIAGDLLPEPTRDQLIATGFNRNHMINFEGGAIPEEYHVEYVIDRVETVSTVWMAMTMGCARCHDHKYDPIKQREFYEFYAFFNSVDEKGLDGSMGNAAPVLALPGHAQQQRLDELKIAMKSVEADLPPTRIDRQIADWERLARESIPRASSDALEGHYEMEGGFADSSGKYRHGRIMRGEPLFRSGSAGRAASFDVDTHVALDGTESVDISKPFTVAFWMRPSGQVAKPILHKMDDADSKLGLEVTLTRPKPIPDGLRNDFDMVVRLSSSEDDAIVVQTKEPLHSGRRYSGSYHVALSYDGSGKASGITLRFDGKPAETEILKDALKGSPHVKRPFEIGAGRFGAGRYTGTLDDLRIYSRVLPDAELHKIYKHEPIRSLLAEPFVDCNSILANAPEPSEDDVYGAKPDKAVSGCKSRQSRLKDYYLTYAAPESERMLYARLQSLKREKEALEKEIPNLMVMRELEQPRETFMLGRGDYRNRTQQVTAATPAWLPAFPADAPRNRLGLANWLVSPANPLTARVAVNRYWQMLMGQGLVKTSEDFGSQGELPTHPRLLDWLASDFVSHGWDIKRLIKQIVMSETYRQDSRSTPELRERDPENRLLARGTRSRLPAEFVRDNALAISGLLNDKIGGASVFPYQPGGIWKELAYGGMFTAQVYRPDTGADLYRRSLYTFWKRTVPPPSLGAFDAPDREKCIGRRARTNTPLQALVLMNDPTYVEASRALAEKMIREGGGNAAKRIRYAYLRALAREPSARETSLLSELAQAERDKYRDAPDQAQQLLAVGDSTYDKRIKPDELAAWMTVAGSILNFDETISKE